MSGQIIHYRQSQIHYHRYGSGSRVLLCFHGFGENGQHFAFLANTLGADFTLYAIDMPLHGQTLWQQELLLEPQAVWEWLPLMGITDTAPLYLLGYSMGGRIALHLLTMQPQRIAGIVLVAPDGIYVNPWYWLATQTSLGNQLFRVTMENPNWFLGLLRFAEKRGLLNKSVTKFVHHYLHDGAVRTALYRRWTTMRRFKPNKTKVLQTLKHKDQKLQILYGKYDRIITPKYGQRWQAAAPQHIQITLIDGGHILLQEKYAAQIAAALNR